MILKAFTSSKHTQLNSQLGGTSGIDYLIKF